MKGEISGIFFDAANYAFYPDTKPVIKKLKSKYKLGIISDTWS